MPLFHGLQRRLHQQRMTGDNLNCCYRAIFSNECMKNDVTGNVGPKGQSRINRLGLADDFPRLNLLVHTDANSSLRQAAMSVAG